MSKKLKLKRIKQIGPTCGIFAIVMIMKSLGEKKNPYELAGKILYIACKSGNKKALTISNIGEIFDVNNFKKLLDEINTQLLDITIKLNCEIQEFNNSREMMDKIKTAIDNNKYIIFPYISGINGKSREAEKEDNTPMHWCVIHGYKDEKILFKESSKTIFTVSNTAEKLFKSNKSIHEKFYWDKYKHKKYYAIIPNRRKFLNEFTQIRKEKLKGLKEKSISDVNVKHMMIIVGKCK